MGKEKRSPTVSSGSRMAGTVLEKLLDGLHAPPPSMFTVDVVALPEGLLASKIAGLCRLVQRDWRP